jgi:hypothetical protein
MVRLADAAGSTLHLDCGDTSSMHRRWLTRTGSPRGCLCVGCRPLGDWAFDHGQPKLSHSRLPTETFVYGTDPNVRLLLQRTSVDCSKSKSSSVPSKSAEFPKEMAVRPSQLRAAAAESALMIPAARALQNGYRQLKMPVIIVAGADDRFVESENLRNCIEKFPIVSCIRSQPLDTWCIKLRPQKLCPRLIPRQRRRRGYPS